MQMSLLVIQMMMMVQQSKKRKMSVQSQTAMTSSDENVRPVPNGDDVQRQKAKMSVQSQTAMTSSDDNVVIPADVLRRQSQ